MNRTLLVLGFFLGALVPAFAVDGVAIVDVRVFDGSRVRDHMVVVVEGERVASVVPLEDYRPADDVEQVSGRGLTLLPGLIDCHTHPLSAIDLRQSLAFGVTTSLSMMNRPAFAKEILAGQRAGRLRDLADLRAAGNPVTPPGGHGTQFGIPIPTVRGADAMRAFVDARVAEGSQFVKIMFEHGELYKGEIPGFTEAELKAAVSAAHANDRRAVVHVSSLAEGLAAFEAGADGLVHVWMDRVPTREQLARSGPKPFVVPTLAVIEGIARRPGAPAPMADVKAFGPYLTPTNRTSLLRTWVGLELHEGAGLAQASKAVKALLDAGYPILAGADAPNPGVTHGVSLHRELELLVAAGLTPSEALTAATEGAARAFGLDDRGRIAPGLRADLLLVRGDPTESVLATREIVRVWKAGTPFDREGYATAVQAERARVHAIPAPAKLGDGLAADFEQGRVATRFGSLFPSTDAIRGGDSSVRLSVVSDGGAGKCLRLEGTVTPTAKPFRWSAVFFAPGALPMAPSNLSSKAGIRFRIRGAGPIYLGIMAQRLGPLPVMRHLEVGEDWREVRFTWAELDGLDGTDVSGFLFGADRPGEYWLELDDLRFE